MRAGTRKMWIGSSLGPKAAEGKLPPNIQEAICGPTSGMDSVME